MNKAQIEHLINKIFKILPLAEEGNENIKDYFLHIYLNNV